ncbi:MAG: ParB/RepB/Spo0J family partition protein [Bacilli bacterium]|nr:ParB/RepB/Spo0J family partition protein [Bacilli bacterium]
MYDGYEQKDEVVQLYLDDIIPNRFQPREVFEEKALKELAVSIKEHGVIQPIIVRNVNGKYEIIAGERRYKASALAGLTKIPAIIRNLDDKETSKVALLENLQRKNLNPIEEARTYQKILELDQMTQEELAKTMGKSQSSVANKLRLLSLPEEIQNALLKEQISERHARALLSVPDQNAQKELMNKVMSTKMSVRALEDEIQTLYPKAKDAADIPIDLNATAGGFLNSTPLTPTTLEEQSDNYGKVVIAPPQEVQQGEDAKEEKEEEVVSPDKFVNYGEIGKDTNPDIGLNGATIPTETEHVDVNEIKAQAEDIKPAAGGAALDNLLHIETPAPKELSKEEKAEKENYFQSPDLPAIKIEDEQTPIIPSINIPTENDTMVPGVVVPQEGYTIEDATTKLKELVDELQQHGVKIHADEMNFPKSYQIIIKIDKE